MNIEFGVIDHIDRQVVSPHETFDSRLKLMAQYDQAGFSTFHVTEHHFTPLGLAPSPLIFLAAASQVTSRIRLCPLVLIATLYNPMRLAEEICMVDHLSKGRLDFATGRGVSPYELAYFGVNHTEAPSIYREAHDVLMMALTQDVVNFRGNYFKFFNVPIEMKPYQKPHPPLWYATGVPDSAEWAGKEGRNICFLQPAARSKLLVERFKAGWAKSELAKTRKMPKVGLTRHIYVAETDEKAVERGMFGYEGWYEKFAYLWAKHDPRPSHYNAAQHRATGTIIMGSPATVRAEIEKQIAETGVNYFVTRFAYGDLTHEESERSLELFTKEVMPHFRKQPALA
jgi:alkanesulfonate monooxygenase SsuD/methylene tetrahydromethanopterin reductase-like flavin-dependent oxidoreductase (luciferase family)